MHGQLDNIDAARARPILGMSRSIEGRLPEASVWRERGAAPAGVGVNATCALGRLAGSLRREAPDGPSAVEAHKAELRDDAP